MHNLQQGECFRTHVLFKKRLTEIYRSNTQNKQVMISNKENLSQHPRSQFYQQPNLRHPQCTTFKPSSCNRPPAIVSLYSYLSPSHMKPKQASTTGLIPSNSSANLAAGAPPIAINWLQLLAFNNILATAFAFPIALISPAGRS